MASKLGTTRLVIVSFDPSHVIFLTLFYHNMQIDRFCFGFIEFESRQSMQAAIEVGLFPDCSSIFRTVVRIAKLLSLNCVLTLV